jgi:hypothetical protein
VVEAAIPLPLKLAMRLAARRIKGNACVQSPVENYRGLAVCIFFASRLKYDDIDPMLRSGVSACFIQGALTGNLVVDAIVSDRQRFLNKASGL